MLLGVIGTPRLFQQAGTSTYLRIRERGTDQFAITTNVDTGSTQDDVSKPSYIASIGGGLDKFSVSRAPAGSSTYTDLISLTGSLATISQNLVLGAIGSPKQFSIGMNATLARLREGEANDAFRITTNMSNSNAQDDATKSSWRVILGYATALDDFRIGRIPAGSTTISELFRIDSTGAQSNLSKSKVSTNSLTTATLSVQRTYFTGTAGASFAITLPAGSATIDGIIYTVMSTAARASTTWASSGATFVGTPSSLTANVPVSVQYHHASTEWFITA